MIVDPAVCLLQKRALDSWMSTPRTICWKLQKLCRNSDKLPKPRHPRALWSISRRWDSTVTLILVQKPKLMAPLRQNACLMRKLWATALHFNHTTTFCKVPYRTVNVWTQVRCLRSTRFLSLQRALLQIRLGQGSTQFSTRLPKVICFCQDDGAILSLICWQ